MKANLLITKRLTVLAFSIISLQLPVFAQVTAFSYEGRLKDNGSPANGTYDLRFAIYDAGTNGSLIGGPDTNSATGVTNGLFCVTLDFGNGVFDGSARWLEIAARTNGAAEFTALAPRQAVMPVPYALYAPSAGSAAGVSGGVSASQITGTLALAQLPGAVLTNGEQGVSLNGSFSGVDNTNLDNQLWMYEKADCLEDNLNVGRYGWTNAIAKLRAGRTIRIEVDGTGLMQLMFPYFLAPLTNTLGQPAGMFNNICYGGGGLAGFFWPGNGNNNFTWTWNSYIGVDQGLDSTWFAGALLFTNVLSAINIGAANPMPYPWDTVEVDYYLFTNGATFKVQTNNNAGGSWGDISGTINAQAAGTNTTSFFWTNTLGAQQLGIQITNLSAGTNIILTVGAWDSTKTNSWIIGLQLHSGSFNADELKPMSNCVATLYQNWNPDLILWENYNTTNVLQTIVPGWTAFYKNAVPSAGVVLCGTYPTLSIDQTAPNQYIRSFASQYRLSYFDGQTPFESTNTIFARGLAVPGNDPHFAGCWPLWGYWLYRWLDLQDFYLQGGLTDANAITGGITTNILIGGHTFYYTNGVLVNIQ